MTTLKPYGMEKITLEEGMYKLDMILSIFGKIDKLRWRDLERISSDAGMQFTLTEFKEVCQTCGVSLTLAAPEHQEINRQVEMTWKTFRTIAHSLMLHSRVLEAYIHFSFMHTKDHIFPFIPIKYMINEEINLTTPFKLATYT